MTLVYRVRRSVKSGALIALSFLIAGQIGRAGDLPRVKLQTLDGVGTLTSFAFSPDGKMVAGAIDSKGNGTEGGNLVLWDARTGRIRKALPYEKGWRWLAFSGDGATLATYGYSAANDQERANGVITIWAIRAAKVRATMFIKEEIASSRGRGLPRRPGIEAP